MTAENRIKLVLLATLLMVSGLAFVLASSADRNGENLGGADGILGGDFTLRNADGDVSLSDFSGQIVVLYFGFLNCPEVCPASMGMVSNAMNRLDTDEQNQVQPILVSIDPERDSLDQLAEFTQYFHPRLLGLTGTSDEIEAVAQDYGAFFEVTDSSSPGSAYEFRHSSRYYVIDQNGELVDAMRHSTTASELVTRIRTLI